MEILRGTAGDVPWPELFATLAFAGETCELVVENGLQVHRVAFGDHAVIGASSPLASDSALRLMRTHGVITPAMMPTIASRVAAMPSADPIEVLAEVAELSPETTLLMRRRTMAVAATRVFALANGSYRATHDVTLPIHPSAAIDVRALIYEGVRTHLTDEQLEDAATRHGTMFVLRSEVWEDLPQFGFSPAEMPMVDELRAGASLADLASRYPGIGPRGIHAIVATLLAARALDAAPPLGAAPRASNQHPAALARATDEIAAQRISDRLPVQRTTGQFSTQAPVTGRFAARTSGTFDVPEVPELDVPDEAPPSDTFELAENTSEQPVHTGATFELAEPTADTSDTFELAEQPHSRVSATFAAVEAPHTELPSARISGTFEIEPPRARISGTFEVAEPPRARISGTFAAAQPPPPDPIEPPRPVVVEPPRPAPVEPPRPAPVEPPRPAPATPPRAFTTQPPTTGVFAARGDRRSTSSPATHPALELPPPPTPRPPSGTHAAIPSHPALERPARRPTTPNPAIDPQPVARMAGSHPALEPPARRATPNPAIDPQPVARMPATQLPTAPPARPTPMPVRPTPMPVRPTPMPARTATLQGAPAPAPVPATPAPAPELTASQHHERGMALLDRDLPKAIAELRTAFQMSGDVDHEAALAWAVFCAAPNKETVAKNTKAVLAKAIYQSERPAIAHFYYGRMERMLGRDREALAQFKTVVEQIPRHAEALAEIRMLEARLGPRKK